MSERGDLLSSIASTIKDFRAGEIAQPTADHVSRWVNQFEEEARLPILREVDHVFKQTYFSRDFVSGFFGRQIQNEELAGKEPCKFWKAAHILKIQQQGNSQSEILELFESALVEQCGLDIEECGLDGGAYIYLDDVLFSGGRIGTDLKKWINTEAPPKAVVHILVIATHRLGEWQCTEGLKAAAREAKKEITFHCWAVVRFENRKKYRDTSEVLWPTTIPNDKVVQDYIATEKKFPFEPRHLGGKLENEIFSSEVGRQLLEKEFLTTGAHILSLCQEPSRAMRPLGFSAFGLGFGSMIVTYRNCPNNSPLALWWGDADAVAGPLARWYPLLPRKTYNHAVNLDDLDIL